MNIVVATDNNFVEHCSVMLTSLLNNSKSDITVYVLSENLDIRHIKTLKNLIEKRKGVFNYVNVDSEIVNRFPMPQNNSVSHISLATYYRLFLSDLLPKSVNKVIYLDCDIIIRKPIDKLWNIEIDNFAIGAVFHMIKNNIEDLKRIEVDFKYGYFNAGVLLINLDYWRVHNISGQLINYVNQNYNKILYHDQDALNAVLYSKCLRISCKWNTMSNFYYNKDILKYEDTKNGVIFNTYDDYKLELLDVLKSPTILHYVARPKPWENNCTHPFRFEYLKNLILTFGLFRKHVIFNFFSIYFIASILKYFKLKLKNK